MTLRVVFAGTPEFAVPCLRALLAADVAVVAVLTQPDRPAGRGRQLQPSPVKQLAQSAGVPVWQPESLRGPEIQDRLRALQADLMVVVAYGLILPKRVLELPRFGCWNVHASLLPRWRGAAPIQRAVEAGDMQSGVCLMQMEKGLDTGPVLLRRAITLDPRETSASLHDRLAVLGAEVLAEGVGLLADGRLPAAEPQPELGVSYAHKLDKAEARLDWTRPAEALERSIRAMLPWPVAELEFAGEVLRVHAAEVTAGEGRPGERLASPRGQLVVACGEGALRLLRVQRAGGRVVDATDYLNASQPQAKREQAAQS